MDRTSLIETWRAEERQPFAGWDFSYLDGRMLEEQAPWSYTRRAAEILDRASSVIDLDTGGGERLLRLREHWPRRVVATEAYPPNVSLAYRQLAPFGAGLVIARLTDEGPMPFADGAVDVVLNRHGAFNPAEVARVLAPSGTFLTQQVHGLWAHDLLAVFGATPQWPDATPEKYVPRLQAAGLTIVDAKEWRGKLAFTDIGAIVYYLKAVPWLVPGFSVERYLGSLLQLQDRLNAGEELAFSARKYLIEATKPHPSAIGA